LIHPGDFNEIRTLIDSSIEKAFLHQSDSRNIRHIYEGQNIIIREVVKNYVNQILAYDQRYAPFEIISMENQNMQYSLDFEIKRGVSVALVGLSGIIDRVDKKENQLRILDYKSGSDDRSFGGIASLFDRENSRRNKAAFQTILYSLIYFQNTSFQNIEIIPSLYNIRDMYSDNFDFRIQIKENRTTEVISDIKPFFGEFGNHLRLLLEEIFADDTKFVQTNDLKKCSYCPYAGICKRN